MWRFMKSSEPDRVRVGILGCSDIAVRKFIPALLKCDQAVLRAFSSTSKKNISDIPGAVNITLDSGELIASADIDLIYISLPNHLHEEWTIRALESGRHVICEKPLGLSLASVQRMLDCAAAHDRLLFENVMFLYHPQHAAVKAVVDGGEIGDLLELRGVFGIPELHAGNFRMDPEQGGGAFHDMARYPVAAALYFLGADEFSFKGFAFDRGELNKAVYGCAATSSGRIFSYSMRFGQQYECWYELVGSSGTIRVDRAFTTPAEMENVITVTTGEGRRVIPVPPADHFRLALDHACSLIIKRSGYDSVHARSFRIAGLAEKMMEGCTHVDID